MAPSGTAVYGEGVGEPIEKEGEKPAPAPTDDVPADSAEKPAEAPKEGPAADVPSDDGPTGEGQPRDE